MTSGERAISLAIPAYIGFFVLVLLQLRFEVHERSARAYLARAGALGSELESARASNRLLFATKIRSYRWQPGTDTPKGHPATLALTQDRLWILSGKLIQFTSPSYAIPVGAIRTVVTGPPVYVSRFVNLMFGARIGPASARSWDVPQVLVDVGTNHPLRLQFRASQDLDYFLHLLGGMVGQTT